MLYDVSSAAFEGRHCPLGAIGYARDGVKGRRQIVYGLLCTTAGVPVAIEVFDGNTADPKTLTAQIRKLTTRFGLSRVALVGDRGMLTSARITEELRPAHVDWLSALRADQIKALVAADALQLSLFDEQNLVAITHPDYPGERLIGCRNPALAAERTRKRGELLAATETELDKITAATRRERQPLRGKDTIGLRVGKVINTFKMAKHFTITITEDSFTFCRNEDTITAEAALDGIYVLRTSLPADTLTDDNVVLRYKGLEDVERFFRTLNSELDVRPIRHHLADRVRAHMFLRMLSYYISWYLKPGPGPNPVLRQRQTRRSRQTRRPRRRGPTLRPSAHQSRAQTHPRRRRGTQLHQPARRPGHHLRQPHPARRRHAGIHHDHQPHSAATPGLRPARPLPPPRLRVVSNPHRTNHKTPAQRPKPSTKQGELRVSPAAAGRVRRRSRPGRNRR